MRPFCDFIIYLLLNSSPLRVFCKDFQQKLHFVEGHVILELADIANVQSESHLTRLFPCEDS